jgi:hypothetical protein
MKVGINWDMPPSDGLISRLITHECFHEMKSLYPAIGVPSYVELGVKIANAPRSRPESFFERLAGVLAERLVFFILGFVFVIEIFDSRMIGIKETDIIEYRP